MGEKQYKFLVKVRRLEEVAQRNDEELSALSVDGKPVLLPSSTTNPDTGRLSEFAITISGSALLKTVFSIGSVNSTPSHSGSTEGTSNAIQSEISALKARLAGTDQELQKTNSTLRYGTG